MITQYKRRLLSLVTAIGLVASAWLPVSAEDTPPATTAGCTHTEQCTAASHQPGCPAATDAAAETQVITGFPGPSPLTTLHLGGKVPAQQLGLPDVLPVYLDGSQEPVSTPVTWCCDSDYAATDLAHYTFSPRWDSAHYTLDPALSPADLPCVELQIDTPPAAVARQAANVVIVIEGSAVSKLNVQKVLTQQLAPYSADAPAGDVTLILNPTDLRVNINQFSGGPTTFIDLPTDKGITSFTLTTTKDGATDDTPVVLWGAVGEEAKIYANGIPFIVDGPVSVGATIYGGSHGADCGSTSITYNGAAKAYNRTTIYGGGDNGSVNGSTQVTVQSTNAASSNGNFFSVYGGGDAEGIGAVANVSGSTHVDIYGDVISVVGGGQAYYGATANVQGNTNTTFHAGSRLLKKVYGGGYAYNYYADETDRDTRSVASVIGTAHITVDTALSQSSDFYDGDYIVGGGYTKIGMGSGNTAPIAAIAEVGGVDIQVNADISANTESTTDRCIVGGGDNDGSLYAQDGMNICRSDVLGAVQITVAPGISLNNAIIGGGSCFGSRCEVAGQVSITVGDGAVIGGLIGGGVVNCNIKSAASADVGSVAIHIGSGVSCRRISPASGQFIGGGNPRYRSGSSYDPSGSHADVKGDIATTIGDDFHCDDWFFAAGLAKIAGTTAEVQGGVSTTIGSGASISQQYIGGGDAENAGCSAAVAGSVTNMLGGNFSCSYFTPAGRVTGTGSAVATVGSSTAPGAVNTVFQGGGTAAFSGSVVGAGRTYIADSDTTVYGDTSLTFSGVLPNQVIYAGGYAGAAGSARVTGAASLTLKDLTATYNKYLYGGGQANAAGANADVGAVDLLLDHNAQISNWTFGGGYAVNDASASARVHGSVLLQVKNCDLGGAYLLGGGWGVGSGHVEVDGNTAVALENSAVKQLYGTGYYSAATNYTHAGHVDIRLKNAEVIGAVYPAGNSNSKAKSAALYLLGNTSLSSVTSVDTASLTDGLSVYVGDGSTPTSAAVGYLYESRISQVHVYPGATLTHTSADNRLLWNTADLQVDTGGTLVLSAFDESISGNFIGGGTLQLSAGQVLHVGGAVSENSALQISGVPAALQTCVTAGSSSGTFSYLENGLGLKKAVGQDKTVWSLDTVHTVTASVTGGHGTVSPAGDTAVISGEDLSFRFTPDSGYKVEQVLLDGRPVPAEDCYTLADIQSAHALQVSFSPLVAQDVEAAVGAITPPEDSASQHSDDVLTAKILYELLEDDEKGKVSPDSLHQLNSQLAQLDGIQIEMQKHVNVATEVDAPMLYQLADTVTLDEARQLKEGAINKITLKLVIDPVESADSQIDPAQAGGRTIGMYMDISVLKQVGGQAAEPITATSSPIQIAVTIPPSLRAPGRSYVMLRAHGGQVDILPDLDSQSDTITINSDRFSTYAIAYTDEPGGGDLLTVTFDAQGGSSVSPYTGIRQGAHIPAPDPPHRTGYIFAGWYLEPDTHTAWQFAGDTVQQNITLYARWEKSGSTSGPADTQQPGSSSQGGDPNGAAGQSPGAATGDRRPLLPIWALLGSFAAISYAFYRLFTIKKRGRP
ncbi:InlB B-repeat-containing protein [Neobittarella massiliensis]|uniref:InlB B-repeat-containing protein n=1 Tax=Neobittarella massiliensis (ex Bilen et al. 2018) TaxID=2041842 RepID=UPI000CF70A8D|nr:InlB B-repeat-containing protein [Neobittarella massiliensis]